jgi:molecular chaperone DnaK
VIRNLAHAAWARDPDYGVDTLNWYASRVSEATDLPRAHELIARGRELCGKNDAAGLRTVNAELDRLFPASSEKRLLSFGSGVQ